MFCAQCTCTLYDQVHYINTILLSHAGADYSMLPPLTSQDNNFAQDFDEYDNANQDEVHY